MRNQNLVEPAHCTDRKASNVHSDSSRQKEDKGKPNILVTFVSNIAALRPCDITIFHSLTLRK